MPKFVLYGIDPSPPTRACLMTLKALNLEFEYRIVNPQIIEELPAGYLEKNPLHTVPILEEDGRIIVDSHVICTYLIQKYGSQKDQSLYPSDLEERLLIDQKLYFVCGNLFAKLKAVAMCVVKNPRKIPQEYLDGIGEAYDFLEIFLKNSEFIAGNNVTIADICCIVNVTSMTFYPLDPSKYPKTTAWINKMQQLPFYGPNKKGAYELSRMIQLHLKAFT